MMKNKPTKAVWLLILTVFILSDLALVGVAFMPVEHSREDSPDKRHTVIVTQRFYQTLLPASPGDSGPAGGFISIENDQGRSMGKIPVSSVDMLRDLVWSEEGASIKLVGSWDFTKKEVRYWKGGTDQEIVKQVGQ